MTDALSVGSLIRMRREEKGLSARALSMHAGLSESYVGKIESGALEPSFRTFSQIAVVLGFTASELLVAVRAEAARGRNSCTTPCVESELQEVV